MKKLISLLLAALMAVFGFAAMPVWGATAKAATITVSVYDGKFVLSPSEISVSADLSDKYAASVGYNDSAAEPTILDAFLAASLHLYGESFTSKAPFKIKVGEYGPSITAAFGKETSSVGYWLDGQMAYGVEQTVANGNALEINFFQGWSDVYTFFDSRTVTAAVGDSVTLTLHYTGYDESYNPMTLPAAGLTLTMDGKPAGTTDENGKAKIKISKNATVKVSAQGEINGNPIFAPYCEIKTTALANYIRKQTIAAAKYLTDGVSAYSADEAINFLTYLNSGYDMSKYTAGFMASVKENLKANGGKLISSYTEKEDIGLYGAVISALSILGADPTDFEGYNIVSAFEAVDLKNAVSAPYYYRLAIEAAEPDFAKTLCDDLIERYYVKGKGLNNWGYSCDNTCYFLTSIAKYKDSYPDYVADAKAVIKTYTKSNGAYSDNKYVTTVNADSTALAMMAFASVGDIANAKFYHYWLVKSFEGSTGLFTLGGTVNNYATKEALLGLEYYKKAVCDAGYEHEAHITVAKTVKATVKKNGKTVETCKICGKAVKTTVIYRPKKIKISKKKYKYTGKKISPKVTVYNSKGKKIAKKYYTVKYKNNRKKGKATIVVKFKGKYKGTMKKTFKIVKK